MMKKYVSYFMLMLFFAFSTQAVMAQDDEAEEDDATEEASAGIEKKGCDDRGYCWGDNLNESKQRYVFFSDEMKAKRYDTSVEPFEWLLANVPYLHKNLYIQGINLYKGLLKNAEASKDAAKIATYQDKILSLYDQRIKYFGNEKSNLPAKGRLAYGYLSKRDNVNYPELLAMYERIFELEGKQKASIQNVGALFAISAKLAIDKKNADIEYNNLAKKADKKAEAEAFKASEAYTKLDTYNEDWMLAQYEKIGEVIDYQIASGNPKMKSYWEKTKATSDGLLPKVVAIDCKFVEEKMAPRFRADKTNVPYAKKVLSYMLSLKCADSPLFPEVAEAIYASEPDAGLANVVAANELKAGNVAKAIEWKEKSLALYTPAEAEKKAEAYLDIARLQQRQGQKSAARSTAYKAIETSGTVAKAAYELIGDLYYNSGNDCHGADPVAERANFLAAYDMYQKAGDGAKMAKAQAQFPTMADIFTYASKGYEVGGQISVGCWIGGTATIRKRP